MQKKATSRAIELFEKAKVTGARNPRLLKEIIASLLQYDHVAEANAFLNAYPPEFRTTLEYAALNYAVTEREVPIGASIDIGRNLIQQGVRDFLVYQVLIRRTLEAGLSDHAEQLISAATAYWPDKTDEIQNLKKEVADQLPGSGEDAA